MTKKPKPPLKLVGSEGGATTTEPLRDLGMHGRKLWNDVMREYEIADAGGLEMLTQACQALDRAETLHDEINRDGAVIRVRGTVRDHPALKHELSNRAFIVRTLARLGLNFEPIRSTAGRPAGLWP